MNDDSPVIGWIFRCDLCGRDEKYIGWWLTTQSIAMRAAENQGWLIRDREQGGYRCPKCNEDAKR